MSTVKIRLWQIEARDTALKVSTTPQGNREGTIVWLPRSQIEHISRMPEVPGQWREITVTIPEWLAEKKGLV